MSIQRDNGYKARIDGYARTANPVAYCLNGVFNVDQARSRDQWFAGWDDADYEKNRKRIERAFDDLFACR